MENTRSLFREKELMSSDQKLLLDFFSYVSSSNRLSFIDNKIIFSYHLDYT